MSDDPAGHAAGHAWSFASGIGALIVFVLLSGFWDCTDSTGATEQVYSLFTNPSTVPPPLGESPPLCTMSYFSFINSPWAAVLIGLVVAGITYLVVDFATSARRKAARGGAAA